MAAGRYFMVRRSVAFAALSLAAIFEGCFGPKGGYKMLVEMGKTADENLAITNDGLRIAGLLENSIKNPVGKLFIEAVKTQGEYVGDGVKSTAILIGHLIMNALKLVDDGLRMPVILRGYNIAYTKALELLEEAAIHIPNTNIKVVENVASTTLTSRGIDVRIEYSFLPKMIVDAVLRVSERRNNRGWRVDLDNVKIEVYGAGHKKHSKLVNGIIVKPAYELEKLDKNIPSRVENARIALINCPLEVEKLRIGHELLVREPKDIEQIRKYEREYVEKIVEKFKEIGVNVILCSRRVDPLPQFLLGKSNIMLSRNISISDLKCLAKATGGRIINVWSDIDEKDLGCAELVRWDRITPEGDLRIFVEGCLDPKSVTLLILGSSVIVRDAIKNTLKSVAWTVEDGRFVIGGGAIEIELANRLKSYAKMLDDMEQLAVNAFAESILGVPMVLVKNAGVDWLEALPKLVAEHNAGNPYAAIDCLSKQIVNGRSMKLFDSFRVKQCMLKIAGETAIALLRVNQVLKSER